MGKIPGILCITDNDQRGYCTTAPFYPNANVSIEKFICGDSAVKFDTSYFIILHKIINAEFHHSTVPFLLTDQEST